METTETYLEKSLKAIEEKGLVFIDEIAPAIGVSRATFYNHGLDKLDSIKDCLTLNRVKRKSGLRRKWYENDNATTQIALYKLLAETEELERLNGKAEIKVTGLEAILEKLNNTDIV